MRTNYYQITISWEAGSINLNNLGEFNKEWRQGNTIIAQEWYWISNIPGRCRMEPHRIAQNREKPFHCLIPWCQQVWGLSISLIMQRDRLRAWLTLISWNPHRGHQVIHIDRLEKWISWNQSRINHCGSILSKTDVNNSYIYITVNDIAVYFLETIFSIQFLLTNEFEMTFFRLIHNARFYISTRQHV